VTGSVLTSTRVGDEAAESGGFFGVAVLHAANESVASSTQAAG
jgi:hypothetical protein